MHHSCIHCLIVVVLNGCSPQFLSYIVDVEYRRWAKWLNRVWLRLGRRALANVSAYPERHSLIPVPKPFIVAGGRFREFYYWYVEI